ncbi:hypothetical protein HDU83_001877 [Entophlyctis luteolus]|nr:hypothetical protein HDU83_001877 [Entophlyctis luteolus]
MAYSLFSFVAVAHLALAAPMPQAASSMTSMATATASAATAMSAIAASTSAAAPATTAPAAAAATVVAAASTVATATTVSAGDLTVLNFALTLENLESTFYQQGLAKFTAADFQNLGLPTSVFTTFQSIAADEATHVLALQTLIQNKFGVNMAVPSCTYNFQAALANAQAFITTASVLERTGVQAYDGAAHLIAGNDVKNAAAAIGSVEARHSSFLNMLTGSAPNPGPFETELGVRPIVTIAAGLITACPYALPAAPFPALATNVGNTPTTPVAANTAITLMITPTAANIAAAGSAAAATTAIQNTALFCGWAYGISQIRTPITQVNTNGVVTQTCTIPAAIPMARFSQAVLFAVNADTDVTLDNDLNVVAGPATVFITV